jgi:predicted ATPase
LAQTHLEQISANRKFREIAEFLASVRYLHVVPQLIREPERSAQKKEDPYGGDFLDQVVRTKQRAKLARLRRVSAALKVVVPQLQELHPHQDAGGHPHLRGRFQHWRPQGKWQDERDFSDGTLRLIGLLWAALDGGGPLLLEEPELSLHPAIVRHLPQMFARLQRKTGRQVFMSTHSVELLHDTGIGLNEVVLLKPGQEGTAVSLASDHGDIKRLIERDGDLADAVMPATEPASAEQLTLWADRK